jgi:hypothetical protein
MRAFRVRQMAHRTFVDQKGTSWQVWEVHPSSVERRMHDRRVRQRPREDAERRRGRDRRQRHEQRIYLGTELAQGWLAFDSGRERRRYAPIPTGWEKLGSAKLADLCREAKIVRTDAPRSSNGGSKGEPTEYPGEMPFYPDAGGDYRADSTSAA